MCSFTFNFRASTKKISSQGKIFIRLIHQRKCLCVSTSYKIFPHEWDEHKKELILPVEINERSRYLNIVYEGIKNDTIHLQGIISKFDESLCSYTVREVVTEFANKKGILKLSQIVYKFIYDLRECGQDRTARAYASTLKSVILFNNNKEIKLEHINRAFLKRYQDFLRARGKTLNTISFYMRNLRAIFNKAIHCNYMKRFKDNPFEEVYTGVHVTNKRALNKHELKLIYEYGHSLLEKQHRGQLTYEENQLLESVLIFTFCFLARGMSFVDLAYLRKENIKNDVIYYFRKKTGQPLEIKINHSIKKILDIFSNRSTRSVYVFPILQDETKPSRLQYETALRLQNMRLKKIAETLGIKKNLSTHVSRHSWATLAKHENLPLSLISEGLGHANEKTTYIYLASFEKSVIDNITDKIWYSIKNDAEILV